MSFVIAAPDVMVSAASDLAGIGSMIHEANASAAVSTTGLIPAAGDEVSTAIASLFSDHAWQFQQLSAQAATFHYQFVQTLADSAIAYATAETSNAMLLASDVGDDLVKALLFGALVIAGGALLIVFWPVVLGYAVIIGTAILGGAPYL